MIDLHGLHVAEAIRIAKDRVQAARSRNDKVVHFIVGECFDRPYHVCIYNSWSDLGKGLHANYGEAKIRPALQGHFNKYVRHIAPVSIN